MMSTLAHKVALVMMLMAATSWAQQPPDSSASPTQETNRGDKAAALEPHSAPDAKSPVTPAEPTADPTSGATASGSRVVSPPEEYRASEQISEDLSVSFPVDI